MAQIPTSAKTCDNCPHQYYCGYDLRFEQPLTVADHDRCYYEDDTEI